MLERALVHWLDQTPLRRRLLEFLSEQGVTAYLVGGTVRDALMQRESCDIDLAVDMATLGGSAMALGRRLADRLHGAYVPLDAERDVARVVWATELGPQHVDVAALRGPDIDADLEGRDYTVNAMAVPARPEWGALIDPTGGERDLAARLLRVVSRLAYRDDPLRILRGIRLRASLGFSITPDTETLMRAWLAELARVSGERVRDEILLLLACPNAAPALRYGQSLGAFQVVLPASITSAVLTSGADTVALLDEYLPPLLMPAPDCGASYPSSAEFSLGAAMSAGGGDLGRFLPDYAVPLRRHWSVEPAVGHPLWVLLKLAAWLGSAVPPADQEPSGSAGLALAGETMRRLRLSVHEGRYLAGALEAASRVCGWADGLHIGPLEAYRYYRRTGEAGVDGAILALVRRAAGAGPCGESSRPAPVVAHTRFLLQAWFERRSAWVDPPALLTGHDLMSALGLKPGPEIGERLERVREAQVQDLVRTKEQALSYIKSIQA